MPLNSIPPTTTVENLEAKRAAAPGQCWSDVAFWGGVIPGNQVDISLVWYHVRLLTAAVFRLTSSRSWMLVCEASSASLSNQVSRSEASIRMLLNLIRMF